MTPPETRITFCRVCEATCGLEVDVDPAANRVLDIRPDPEHVVSRGYACVKGTRFDSVQNSPDRLTQEETPQRVSLIAKSRAEVFSPLALGGQCKS